MKKAITVIILLPGILVTARLIPFSRKKEILIENKFEHVSNLLTYPVNWIKWYPELRAAWRNDTAACIKKESADGASFSLTVPGRKVYVHNLPSLQYEVRDSSDGASSFFIFSVSPAMNIQQTTLVYVQQTNLLYTVFSFLMKNSVPDKAINALQFYLEDVQSFYGFKIVTQQPEAKAYIVKKIKVPNTAIFAVLPAAFNALEDLAGNYSAGDIAYNSIAFLPLGKDSTEVSAGIALNITISGNDSIQYMQMRKGVSVLTGYYSGIYANRKAIYSAMSLFMLDKGIPPATHFYERFKKGSLPVSDSSVVQFELCLPYYPR
ncbi:MAG: hypothetical protein KF746_23915 [Chitinophagaceae bacterium]|nr:hypothetical protein [Chitinophagaceae bacterium]